MDVSLARTFLEIVRSGSFISAAEKLHVTQTTVTARIHNLEGQLGCKLFVRNRSGASLTSNGVRFVEHATKMVQSWELAKRDLPLPEGVQNVLNIGSEVSLWSPLVLQWLNALNITESEVAIRAEIGERQSLMEQLENGVLDIILVHQPEYWPGVQVEQLLEEKLIHVSSVEISEPYVYVDWGEDFRRQHDVALPELASSNLTISLGPLALHYILTNGGSGYFRTRVVEHHIKAGLLKHNEHFPEFTFPVYVLYKQENKIRYASQLNALYKSSKIQSPWLQ
jgi:DNA-binding transcriptional LysR family regulator